MRAELNVDRLAFDFVGPFEVGAMTPSGILVAGTVRLAALHHALGDGPLQEILQVVEFLPGLAEALGRDAEEGWAGCFARGHAYRFPQTISFCINTVVIRRMPKHFR